MAKREFLMLAHNYKPEKHCAAGAYLSEKLDGLRVFWDGGITRGWDKSAVPWANTTKDSRYLEKQISTGLWSRYGHVFHAPDEWLDAAPKMMLDGELWAGYIPRQELSSIVKPMVPDSAEWARVQMHCFDMPHHDSIFADGLIDNVNFKKLFRGIDMWNEIKAKLDYHPMNPLSFRSANTMMGRFLTDGTSMIQHEQELLSSSTPVAEEQIAEFMDKVMDRGGEGAMIRSSASFWTPERIHQLVKIKKLQDDEGIVVGYTTGRQTDKGSKLLGMMGALWVVLKNGKRMKVSGFNHYERLLSSYQAKEWAIANPGEQLPEEYDNLHFPRGASVTFRFRDLTKDGIPQEARYWRGRDGL